MAYWLFKSEPNAWSWEDQKKVGKKGDEWDGVRNYQARNFMQDMVKGDLGFFYHSIKEKRVVGILTISKPAHPDSTDGTGKWFCVDVAAIQDVPNPVTLDEIKATPQLEDMVLVNNSRLSVQPVTEAQWKKICKMGGLKTVPLAKTKSPSTPATTKTGARKSAATKPVGAKSKSKKKA